LQSESAAEGHGAHDGLLQAAKFRGSGGGAGGAGLWVQEDGGDHGAEVATHTLAIVDEQRGDALHVGGGGVIRDEELNELTADKGGGVGVLEQVEQRVFDISAGIF
jgi:hypothetical protein